ncbi:BCCT family transporter [Nesterenkonia pannonica]|uniref:BCCT family transporter n=1 Tax=Nesterenkonia pannonica TaxID=1548602 RepID=UPI00216467F7|nr:BCCT family transporter [Nesterenkonia pannonica]
MNWPVFIISAALIVVFTAAAAIWPDPIYAAMENAFVWLSQYLGWYFILTAAIIVVFVLIVAFTRVGKTRLGPDHSNPSSASSPGPRCSSPRASAST